MNIVFQYLKKENISIDKSEFLFQLQSHPDYPNLLAIVDTLNFFDIAAGAFNISLEEYDLLPSYFVTFLDVGNGMELHLFEKSNEAFFYFNGKKRIGISNEELTSKSNGIFLLVEKENKIGTKNSGELLKWLPIILGSTLLIFLIFSKSGSIFNLVFLLFTIVGAFLSIVALKDVFGIQSKLVNNLCNPSATTDCTALINSKKWKIFDYVSFSDLSLLFFTTQIFGYILFTLTNKEQEFFDLQKIIVYSSVPFIALSIYYQKIIEKKWCTICFSIISVLVVELVYLTLVYKSIHSPNIESLALLGLVFFGLIVSWQWIKKVLLKQKELKEFYIKGKRFARNYEIFKNTWVTENKVDYPKTVFEFGNNEIENHITISTNPFCGYCKDAHFLVEKIFQKHTNDINMKILLNIDLDSEDNEEKKDFCRRLASVYICESSQLFLEAFHYWFEHKDISIWNKKYGGFQIAEDAEKILKSHNFWALNNKFQFTPAIFINNYPYPREFDRENIPYFMEEILEDENW